MSINKPLAEAYTITPVSCRIRQWFCAVPIKSVLKHFNDSVLSVMNASYINIRKTKVEKINRVGRIFSHLVCNNKKNKMQPSRFSFLRKVVNLPPPFWQLNKPKRIQSTLLNEYRTVDRAHARVMSDFKFESPTHGELT